MNFSNLRSELKKYEASNAIAPEATLGLLYTLCYDITAATRKDIHQGDVQNYRDLAVKLSFLSKRLCKLYDLHKDELAKISTVKIPEQIRTVEAETRKIEEELLDQVNSQSKLDAQLQRLETAKAQLEARQAHAARTQQQIDDLSRMLERIRGTELGELQARKESLEAEMAAVERQAEQQREELAKSAEAVKRSKTELEAGKSRNIQLQQSLANRRREIEEAEQQGQNLEKELNTCDGALASLNAACGVIQQKIADVNGEQEAMRQKMGDLQKFLEQETVSLQEKQEKAARLWDEIHDRKRSVAALAAENDSKDDELTRLCEQMKLRKEENELLQHRLEMENAALEEIETEVTGLIADIEAAQAMKKACDDRIGALKENAAKVETELNDARQHEMQLDEQVRAALEQKQKLDNRNEEHTRLLEQLANVQEELRCVGIELKNAEDALNAANGNKQSLENRIAISREETAQLISASELLVPVVTEAEAALRTEQDRHDELRTKLEEADTACEELKKQYAAMEEKLARTNADSENCKEQITATDAAFRAASEESASLAKKLASARVQLETQKQLNEKFELSDLKPAQDELAGVTAEMEMMEAARAACGEKITSLKESLENKKREHQNTQTELYVLETLISDSENELNEACEELKRQQLRRDQLARELRDISQNELGALYEEIQQLQASVGDTAAVTEKKVALETVRDRLLQQQADLEHYNTECSKVEKELAQKRIDVAALSRQLEERTREKRETEEEYVNLQKQLAVLDDSDVHRQLKTWRFQIRDMSQIRDSMAESAGAVGCGLGFDVEGDVKARLDQAEASLEFLQNKIAEFVEIWDKTIDP